MNKKLLKLFEYIPLIILALLFIFPLVWMISSSMKLEVDVYNQMGTLESFLPSSNISEWFEPYIQVGERFNIVRYVLNSVLYAVLVTAGSIVVNALAGYAFAKYSFKGKNFLFGLMIALLVIPAETIMITKFSVIQRLGLVNTTLAVVLPLLATPLYIYMFRNFFIAVPEEIIEAARIEGASSWTIFWRIMIPMAKPAVATVGTLSFIASWNDYIWPLMVLTETERFPLQVAITNINNTPPVFTNQVMAILTISTIPLIIIYIFFQGYLVQGIGSQGTGVK